MLVRFNRRKKNEKNLSAPLKLSGDDYIVSVVLVTRCSFVGARGHRKKPEISFPNPKKDQFGGRICSNR